MRLVETRALGRSGLRSSSLWLGTAALAVPYGAPGAERPPPARTVAARTLKAALAAGITAIDTAPAYGQAEALVGDVAGAADCLIATKLAVPPEGWAALDGRATRAAVRASAEASLRVLRRERLDLLQIHNATAEILEWGAILAALEELRAEGLVAAIGATVYGEADALAAIASDEIEVVQMAYSALDRRPERRALPAAAARGTAVTVRSVLLRGVLSAAGRPLAGDPRLAPLAAAAEAFRRAVGASWEELPGAAVAWAARRPGIDAVVLGPRDAEELTELLAGARRAEAAVAAAGDGWFTPLDDALLDPRGWPA